MENNVETDGKTKFLETIANLRKVFFIEYTVQARIIVGLSSDLDVNDHFFNYSLPIMPSIANFHRIGCDPRGIGLDLTRIVFSKSQRSPLNIYCPPGDIYANAGVFLQPRQSIS